MKVEEPKVLNEDQKKKNLEEQMKFIQDVKRTIEKRFVKVNALQIVEVERSLLKKQIISNRF